MIEVAARSLDEEYYDDWLYDLDDEQVEPCGECGRDELDCACGDVEDEDYLLDLHDDFADEPDERYWVRRFDPQGAWEDVVSSLPSGFLSRCPDVRRFVDRYQDGGVVDLVEFLRCVGRRRIINADSVMSPFEHTDVEERNSD